MGYRNDQFYNWRTFESRDPTLVGADANPPFHLHNYDNTRPGFPKMNRGYLRPLDAAGPRFHFLFNPNTLVRDFQVNENNEDRSYLPDAAKTVVGFAIQSFGFAVYLDRQMEMAAPSVGTGLNAATTASDTGDRGVWADIEILDRMFGAEPYVPTAARSGVASRDTGGATNPGTTNVTTFNSTVVHNTPFYAVFSSLLTAAGYMTGISVEMVKFNAAYVPTVATVNFSMQLFYFGRGQSAATLLPAYDAMLAAEEGSGGGINLVGGSGTNTAGAQSSKDVGVTIVGSSTGSGRYP